ncbi:MAG: aminotransferase class V-fold PLP-dependent enzyme [Geobacter sp.]|nr:aminotransferase class V-fold PLP-dependent enzyme [Geobacter sp.]
MSIYLDNAATSFPKPEAVYTAVEHALRDVGVSPGRGSHRRGLAAARLVLEAREALADLFAIPDSSRIVFTQNATEALNLAVLGLLKPGDRVVTTTMEHNSLARPLHLAARRGVEVVFVPADRTGMVDSAEIAAALAVPTRLVALSHCSNVTGTIQPVAEIGALARKRGALMLVDAAQSVGCIPIDVGAMSIDLLAAPGHKGLYGPPGTGFLYIADGIDLDPLMVGGTGTASTGEDQPADLPERFESGTINTPAIAGLLAGVLFVASTGVAAIARHEERLVNRLCAGLQEMPSVRLCGPEPLKPRGSVVSFTVDGMDPGHVGFLLDQEHDIAVRTGLHCAPAAHRTIGTFPAGTVRASPGYFTTDAEIDTFITALRSITRGRICNV